MKISRFWKTLDDLADAATDRREWKSQLGGEFDQLSSLLAPAGGFARSVSCPSPGGEGCPRQVVQHDDGTIRAVCGDRPKACRDLDLTKQDIAILRLDRTKLAHVLARLFGLTDIPKRLGKEVVVQIGTRDIFAGRGFPVFLCMPGPLPDQDSHPYSHLMAMPGTKLLLAPTGKSLPTAIATALDRTGVTRLALENTLVPGNGRAFDLASPVETFLADLGGQIHEPGAGEGGGSAWQLPHDARWEEITIRFIADEVLNVGFRGDIRRLEPDQLGMKNAKDGRPKQAWTYLKAFALEGGRLPVHHTRDSETSKHQKQKQELSKALKGAFGIRDEPIPTEGNEYVTRFVVRADDLQQGRQGQSRRNFVGPD